MRRAKRWLLIFAALLGLMSHAGALRPLFAGKVSTTTSTTTTTTTTEVPETTAIVEETETKAPPTNATTKPSKKLTGIPQIDYVWDPNLPRELNGYNLSSYPFFSTVPPHEEIAFKCDGLHDGFYASIEYKCQVYHHCIYGVRHDFLCANFTAFDQRTFICHFVSQVDCKNSEKFWSRNDALYMATTTTSTTTTSTAPPLIPESEYRRRRPLRRRRPSDYYYDEDYDDDYYEEDRRMNRRRKQRPRGRRPAEYDDDYEERRSYSDDDARFDNKRPKNRDRVRDEEEDDYEDRRSKPRARPKTTTPARQSDVAERRKLPMGRKTAADRQAILDERRSLSDDKPRNKVDDAADVVERRPLAGGRRRKIGERRPAPIDDDYDRPNRRTEEAVVEEEPLEEEEEEKPIEPTPEKELVRPVSSSGNPVPSIFDRPRAPPRIPRPVPITEKRKYEYPAQKANTRSTTTANPFSDEYYDDEEYEDIPPKRVKDIPRRRLQDDLNSRRNDDIPPRRSHSQTRRGSDDFSRRPSRPFQRKPVEPVEKPVEDYDSVPEKDLPEEKVPTSRKRPHAGRDKNADDIDPVEDDTRVSKPRQRESQRRPLKKEDPVEDQVRDHRRDNRRRPASESDRTTSPPSPPPLPEPVEETDELYDDKLDESVDPLPPSAPENERPAHRDGRPVVRVVKRPFLPSRGGSPYLARGLQPVGAALRQTTTDSTPIDMGSTISGVRLLEHGAPILRENSDSSAPAAAPRKGPRTTLPPQVENPKVTLDELYENDYDVTLNDALNPTIKPLSSSNRNFLNPFNKYERGGYSAPSGNYNGDDSYVSSTDVRRRALPAPRNNRQEFRGTSRIAQHFYEDFEY